VSTVADRTWHRTTVGPRAAATPAPETGIPQLGNPETWKSESGDLLEAPESFARSRVRNVSLIWSIAFHAVLMLMLGLLPLPGIPIPNVVQLTATDYEEVEPFEISQEFEVLDEMTFEIGSDGIDGSESMLALAPEVADTSEVLDLLDFVPSDQGTVQINQAVQVSTGLEYNANLTIRGTAGHGVSAAEGALDWLTQEILRSLQERKTAVVWLFDQSGSLLRQRQEIHERIDHIYEELGVIEAADHPSFQRHEDKPLLTMAYAFGEKVYSLLPKPTDNVEEIKRVIRDIELDETGIEHTFTAIQQAVKDSTRMRLPDPETGKPERNVIIVVFTDEVGDDQQKLEATIKMCRQHAMPVYVVGVPALFGRKEAYVKWIDPDPNYDQTPQWGEVDQGPETVLPEHLKLTFGRTRESEVPLDSGFGPYALTRLCVETGGVYFAVHPNRKLDRAVSRRDTEEFSSHIQHFFDTDIMRRYRPDYVPVDEYMRRVKGSKTRSSLVTAAQLSWVQPMVDPNLRFVKRDEATFVNQLTEAQKGAARIEPQLRRLYDVLKEGEADRERETTPRWRAGYDLAMGRVMAVKVRTEGYNAMLAQAKRGMRFEDEKNNTWVLEPSDEITFGSQAEKMAERAREYLERVVEQHVGTPWALLAQKELAIPIGWQWKEEYTDLSPPRERSGGNAGTPSPPSDDRARMLPPPKPTRPPPRL
jgi:hypothetical protein